MHLIVALVLSNVMGTRQRLIDGFWFRGPKQLPMSLVEHKFQVDYTAEMRKYYVTVKNWHKIRRRPMEVLLATHDLTTRMRAVEYSCLSSALTSTQFACVVLIDHQ